VETILSTYERLARLPLAVDGYRLESLDTRTGAGWTRLSTVIQLDGGDHTGAGEDVNYSERDQRAFVKRGAALDLGGRFTLASFSRHLDVLPVFPDTPEYPGQDVYRRWGFESAALDLALRQAGASLASCLDLRPRPVRFVASMRMDGEEDLERVEALAAAQPGLGFKLDAAPAWTDDLLARLAVTGRVEVVDFKGAYEGTPIDTAPDAVLYRRVLQALPEALIEDPHRTPEILALLEPARDRVTWDAPIHAVSDIEAAPWRPRVVNIKPSRFGTLERLLDAYDHCAREGIAMYGGGQFELGPGRGQIQLLASLFHPDAPNDVAPGAYNVPGDLRALPGTPLPAPAEVAGFG
jgi:L-alanine-DL-glutamate epimerase-like enolase superfamily enzyme